MTNIVKFRRNKHVFDANLFSPEDIKVGGHLLFIGHRDYGARWEILNILHNHGRGERSYYKRADHVESSRDVLILRNTETKEQIRRHFVRLQYSAAWRLA